MTPDEIREAAREAASYLREEADFNRSWTDGRRGAPRNSTPEYIARRIEIAEQRERWASAIEKLIPVNIDQFETRKDAQR